MDDLISRQAAIDAMMKLQTEDIEAYGASIPEGFDGDRAVTALKALPSAQQWIPCKTAFPEKENTRVTYQTNAGVIIIDGIYGGIDAYGHRVWLDRERELYWDDEVVAWMPVVIPEPWKGDAP